MANREHRLQGSDSETEPMDRLTDTVTKIAGGLALAGIAAIAIRKMMSFGPTELTPDMALQGNPNGPLDQPGCGIGRHKAVSRDEGLKRFTPPRQYHRYWTEAPRPHHLDRDAFKEMTFTRIFTW